MYEYISARVSTDEQSLAMQLDALHLAGCEAIFEDVVSGADNSRKGLADVLSDTDEVTLDEVERVVI